MLKRMDGMILRPRYDHMEPSLRLRGIMIGRHFHANIKVQTAMCKDNNNSKSRAATYVQFDIYKNDISRLYSVYKIFDF